MSVSDLPGGEALDAMLRKVTGEPGTIDTLAKSWRTESGNVKEFAGGLSAAVQGVDDAWKGRSADQFDTYMRKYGTAASGLKSALSKCAGSLDGAAAALRESHTEIGSIISDLTTNASTYKTQHADATDEEVKSKLTAMVKQAKEDAQKWVDSADRAVTKAKDDINRFLDERGQTFHGIPEVTTQEFTPAPGRKIDWERDPSYQESNKRHTQLQSHDGALYTTGGGNGNHPTGPMPPPGGGPAPTGQVKEWIEEAVKILEAKGVPASKMNASDIWMIIQHESGGNPSAINNWDSNAVNGTPSKGLMQTIDPTFNSYKLSGHGNIYDPVDNIIAGVRYAISRYGSVSNVPGVVNSKHGLGYVGY
ncbi:transglycosylase SLT domain-containing protein [Nonomuraea insulae]|uniref:Transglycosylase SLT domain-containing protein n=1 Tax=Nonomuraea insulae TaxID=1616787 RepID=A0ABW1CP35_9ACTN